MILLGLQELPLDDGTSEQVVLCSGRVEAGCEPQPHGRIDVMPSIIDTRRSCILFRKMLIVFKRSN